MICLFANANNSMASKAWLIKAANEPRRRFDARPPRNFEAGLIRIVSSGHGYITGQDGNEIYFHEHNTEIPFEALRAGEKVQFIRNESKKTPGTFEATRVRYM